MRSPVFAAALFLGASAYGQLLGFQGRIGMVQPKGSDPVVGYGFDTPFTGLPIPLPSLPLGLSFTLSGDYYAQGDDRNLAFAVGARMQTGRVAWGAGIGPSFRRANGAESTGLDWQASATLDLPKTPLPMTVQVKYFGSRSEVSGIGIFLGVRL